MKTKSLFRCVLAIMVIGTKSVAQDIFANKDFQDASGSPLFNPILNQFGIEWSSSLHLTSGDLLTVGYTTNGANGQDIIVTKYDSDGTQIFQTAPYNSGSSNNDYGIGISLAANGDILVCGTTDNGGSTNFDIVILRYAGTGSLLYQDVRDAGLNLSDVAVSIAENPSGDISLQQTQKIH
jgi:hypothetical protein